MNSLKFLTFFHNYLPCQNILLILCLLSTPSLGSSSRNPETHLKNIKMPCNLTDRYIYIVKHIDKSKMVPKEYYSQKSFLYSLFLFSDCVHFSIKIISPDIDQFYYTQSNTSNNLVM